MEKAFNKKEFEKKQTVKYIFAISLCLIGVITLFLSVIKGAAYRDPKDYYGPFSLNQTNNNSWTVIITEDYFTIFDYDGEARKECNYVYKTVATRKDEGEDNASADCIIVTIDYTTYYLYRDSSENVSFYNKQYGLALISISTLLNELE